MTTELRGQLTPSAAVPFLLAGDATVTFRNDETGTRFTFRLSCPKKDTERGGRVADRENGLRFVALLSGPDNTTDYQYLGCIRDGGDYVHGRKSRVHADAPSVEVFAWVWDHLRAGTLPATISIWHEGRCGRCGRALTVPESVASGFGPDCAALLGLLTAPAVAA
jgi:hypothetical protein